MKEKSKEDLIIEDKEINKKEQFLYALSEAIWSLAKVVHGFHDNYGMPN